MKRLSSFFIIVLATTAVFIFGSVVLAHSGRTDKYGGHHNRKTGGYHYHNAGYLHAPSNRFQDHAKCGICETSTKIEETETPEEVISEKDKIIALQLGLKCMGFEIEHVNGVFGSETKDAVISLLEQFKQK